MIKNKSRLSFIILPIIFLLALTCAFSLRAPASISAQAEGSSIIGDGTKNSPKHIVTAENFFTVMELINDEDASEEWTNYYYSLDADIDLSEISDIVPIGTEARPFNGNFNGAGHLISGLTISGGTNNVGLFGYTGKDAVITGVGVVDARIVVSNSDNVGGLVGYNNGTISLSFYQGSVNARQNVGGIAGVNNGRVEYCFSNGNFVASASIANLGGIVGQNHSSLTYSYSIGAIVSSNANATNVGGIIGGRYTSDTSTPTGTFYNGSANEGIDAVGYGANSIDKSPVALDNTRVQHLGRNEFNTLDLQKLFGTNLAVWKRDAFIVTNHSAYVAPLQTIFANRLKENNDALNNKLETACSERMYGIDSSSLSKWGSAENPYLISNETQLRNLQKAVSEYGTTYSPENSNDVSSKQYFYQTANISLTDRFYPIGNKDQNKIFQGVYDGGNNTISGLNVVENIYVNSEMETIQETDYLALFGYIGTDSVIRNLRLDETCSISGIQYVGSVVGYNEEGTIENVESSATVNAQGRTGGIVGVTKKGVITNVLSSANLQLRGNVDGGLYGIVGAYQSGQPAITNAWYFVNVNSKYRATNGMGNVMLFDGINGEVTATKNASGDVEFKKSSATVGYDLEFRDVEEVVKCSDDIFVGIAGQTTYRNQEIYVRFVKSINYGIKNNTNAEYVDMSNLAVFDLGKNKTTKLYDGQSFVLSIPVKDGAYVNGITALDKNSSPINLDNAVFVFNENSSAVEYQALMNSTLDKIEIEIATIIWGDDLFVRDHTYNGEPVEFPVDQLTQPSSYSAVVTYSSGLAPVKAGDYSFTVIFRNEYDVRMGSKISSIRINKRQLSVPLDALQNTKEWDNTNNACSASVDNTKVTNKVENDDVTVTAIMSFEGDGSIRYDMNNNYVSTVVHYEFDVTGKDALNYFAPEDATGNGTIVRRKIMIRLNSYEGEFAGIGKKPSLSGNSIISSGVIPTKPYEASYTFLDDNGVDISATENYGSVGNYRLVVNLVGDSAKYYDVSFVDAIIAEDGVTSYVNFKVIPFKAEMIYLIDGLNKDNVTYDGNSHNVTSYFFDVNGNRVDVNSLTITDRNADTVSELLNAGEYQINATYDDINYDIGASSQKTLVVNKAEQAEITFVSSSTHAFGTDYIAVVVGGSGDGEVEYSVSEDCADMASFNGNVLTITKAGEIMLIATRHDLSGNYNDITVEFILTVNKTEIAICVKDFTVDYLDDVTFEFVSSEGVALSGVIGVDVLLNDTLYEGGVLDADTYRISLSISEDANSDGYILNVGECGVLTVRPLAITVRAENKEGVYGEKLKELTYVISDNRVNALNGKLFTSAINVGDSEISAGTITNENNPNYNINFVPGTYTITPKELIVQAVAQEKKYGEPDPTPSYEVIGLTDQDTEEGIGLSVQLSRFSGENSYIEGVEVYSSYQYRLTEDITLTSNNYTVKYQSAALTILPGTPQIVSKEIVNIAPGTILDDSNKPAVVVSGRIYNDGSWNTQNLLGNVGWKESITPDFSSSDTFTHKVIFTPVNKNYAPLEIDIDVKVIPVEISVTFTSPKEIVYDGYDHDNVKYELVGLVDGIKALEEVTFEGDVKNCGEFKAKITINNKVYKLVGASEETIKITKADLQVIVEDITILEGETPKIEYLYAGFQKGDSAESLTEKPNVSLPTTPGTYTLTPKGARAKNYSIQYSSFTLKILTKSIVDKDNGLSLEGEFDSATKFEMIEADSSSDVSNKYAEVQKGYSALENMGIDKVYDLKYSINNEVITIEGEVYLTMPVPEGYGETKIAYAILTNNGEILYVQDVLYDGDNVTINVTNAKALLILSEQEDNSMMLYVVIGAVVVIVIVIIIIIRAIKKRKESRYIKYND